MSFIVELEDHRMTRRHQDQIFKRDNNERSDNGDLARSRLEEQSGKPNVAEMAVQQTNKMKSNAAAAQKNRREKASDRYPRRERQIPEFYGHDRLTD